MMGIFWVFISVLGVGTGLGLFAITRRGDGSDRAREILAERLARGDITPEEFRERLEALGPHVRSRLGAVMGAAIGLIVVGLIGGFVTAATGGVNPIRSMMGCGMGPMMDGGMGSMMGGETRRLGPSPQPDADEVQVVAGDLFFRPCGRRRARSGERLRRRRATAARRRERGVCRNTRC